MGTLLVIRNLKNTNSGFKLSPENDSIEVTEFTDQTITIHVLKEHFVNGILVSMDFIVQTKEGLREFSATGKITSVEYLDDKTGRVKIALHQFDKKIWSLFLQQLEAKQDHIDELLKSMKGDK